MAENFSQWLWVVRILLVVAFGAAAYLAWVSISHGPVAGCGPDSGCDKVLQSRWAYWLGIPATVPALLVYLALFGATFSVRNGSAPERQLWAWKLIIALSVMMTGAGVWFIGLQAIVIQAFCKFCMTAHLCGLAAAALTLKRVPLIRDPIAKPAWSNRAQSFGIPRATFFLWLLLGFAGVAVLVAGQFLVEKKRNVVKPLLLASVTNADIIPTPVIIRPPPPVPAPASTNLAPTSNPPASKPLLIQRLGPRLVALHGGAFLIPLDEVPMIGSPDAPHLIVSLFDYTCHHCRQLHPLLKQAQQRFGDQLGIISLPMPLATNCNPAITRFFRPHALACDYAQLGLAVWRAKRDAFPQFDDWLFTPEQPVPPAEARQYAAQLVGTEKLEAALADEWITRQIHMDGSLYHTNYLRMRDATMPELMIGSVISFGPLNSVQDLVKLIEQQLGLKAAR